MKKVELIPVIATNLVLVNTKLVFEIPFLLNDFLVVSKEVYDNNDMDDEHENNRFNYPLSINETCYLLLQNPNKQYLYKYFHVDEKRFFILTKDSLPETLVNVCKSLCFNLSLDVVNIKKPYLKKIPQVYEIVYK